MRGRRVEVGGLTPLKKPQQRSREMLKLLSRARNAR
jgi:hypothetical protein